MEDKTIDKLRKLLAKQKSAEKIGSLQEANVFAAKVQELLTKHNLEIADIKSSEEKPKMGKAEFKDIKTRKSEGKWEPALYSTLCKYNYCKLINHTMGSDVMFVSIIGTKENIEIVKFLGDQLQAKIRIFEKMDWHEHGRHTSEKRGKFRRGFFLGAVSGIGHQLEEQQKAQMQNQVKVNALVVQTDKELAEAVNKLFGHLSRGKASRTSSSVGTLLGRERGKSMQINKDMGNKPNKSIQ